MLIVGFATQESPYVNVINSMLIPSCAKFDIPCDCAFPPHRGTWLENEKLKPTVIKEMLLKHKCPVTYVDADATIEQYPLLLDDLSKYDLGVHYFDWYKFWRNVNGNTRRDILGGTIYFAYNEKVLQFIDSWIALNREDMEGLNLLLPARADLKIFPLPIEYCAIEKPDGKVPAWIVNPVIVHHQASRQYRTWKKT